MSHRAISLFVVASALGDPGSKRGRTAVVLLEYTPLEPYRSIIPVGRDLYGATGAPSRSKKERARLMVKLTPPVLEPSPPMLELTPPESTFSL